VSVSAVFHLRGAPDGSTVEVRPALGGAPAGAVVGSAVVLDEAARVDGLQLGLEYVALITAPGRSRSVRFVTRGANVNRLGAQSGTVRLVR
jgi:hypothetical protein